MKLSYYFDNFPSDNSDASFFYSTHTSLPTFEIDLSVRKILFSFQINHTPFLHSSYYLGKKKGNYCAFPSYGISNTFAKGCCISDNSSTKPAMSITFHATAQKPRKWALQMKRQLKNQVFHVLHSVQQLENRVNGHYKWSGNSKIRFFMCYIPCNSSKTAKMSITNEAAAQKSGFLCVTFRATAKKPRKWALQMKRQLKNQVFHVLHSALPIKNHVNEHYKWNGASKIEFFTYYIPNFLSKTAKMSITNEATSQKSGFSRVTFHAATQQPRKWALQMKRQLNNRVFDSLHLVQQTTIAGNKILHIIQNINSRVENLLHLIQFSIRRKTTVLQSYHIINHPFIACLKGIKPSLL